MFHCLVRSVVFPRLNGATLTRRIIRYNRRLFQGGKKKFKEKQRKTNKTKVITKRGHGFELPTDERNGPLT